MTPEQIELARHALGLNRGKVAYRNHFCAGPGHVDYPQWADMVAAGDAVERVPTGHDNSYAGNSIFFLTNQGIAKVLRPGESIDEK